MYKKNLLFQDFGSIYEQRECLLDRLYALFQSKEFVAISRLFGVDIDISKNSEYLLHKVYNELIDKWDFRKINSIKESKNSNVGARWGLEKMKMTKEQEQLAFYIAEKIGITSAIFPTKTSYDYGIVLGGAKLSNYLRFKFLKHVELYEGTTFKKIILLGSERELSNEEKLLINKELNIDASNEYDYFKKLARNEYTEEEILMKKSGEHEYDNSEIVSFYDKGKPSCIAVKAPSTEPQVRRAHTGDTYKFLFEEGYIEKDKSVCSFTSSIYVPYQQLSAYKFHARSYKLNVETVGFPPDWDRLNQGFTFSQNYLQEIRSLIKVAYELVISY